MKQLSFEEFRRRAKAIQRARKIFMDNGLTDRNLNNAFRAYQELLAEEKRDVSIPAAAVPPMDFIIFENIMPTCPKCNHNPTVIREINIPKGPSNRNGYNSAWLCEKCAWERYSFLTLHEWAKILNDPERVKNIKEIDGSDQKIADPNIDFVLKKAQPLEISDATLRPFHYIRCPECGGKVSHVNLPPKGRENRYGYKTLWVCQICAWEKLKYETLGEEHDRLKKEAKKGNPIRL